MPNNVAIKQDKVEKAIIAKLEELIKFQLKKDTFAYKTFLVYKNFNGYAAKITVNRDVIQIVPISFDITELFDRSEELGVTHRVNKEIIVEAMIDITK